MCFWFLDVSRLQSKTMKRLSANRQDHRDRNLSDPRETKGRTVRAIREPPSKHQFPPASSCVMKRKRLFMSPSEVSRYP